MKAIDWADIRYFGPDDNFGDPGKMDSELIYALDTFRNYVGKPVIVHCGWEERTYGYHPKGMAVDCHVIDMALFDQYMTASRFMSFRGIGVYPWWRCPGLHLDSRPLQKYGRRALWGSTAPKQYVKLTKQFLYRTL